MPAPAKKKKPGRPKATVERGREIDPNRAYTPDECMEILNCSRPTLYRYRRFKAFPLKAIGNGLAYGREIIEWIAAQANKRAGGRRKGQFTTK